jgi:hypothetical protein
VGPRAATEVHGTVTENTFSVFVFRSFVALSFYLQIKYEEEVKISSHFRLLILFKTFYELRLNYELPKMRKESNLSGLTVYWQHLLG